MVTSGADRADRADRAARPIRGELALWALLLAAATAASIACNGYSFGSMDHAIHLPLLLQAMGHGADGLVPQVVLQHHPSYLWQLVAPLANLLGVERTFLLLHVVGVATTLLGIVVLARTIYEGVDASRIAILALLLGVVGGQTFAMVPLIDPVLVHRGLVLGPELLALALAVRGRLLLACAVLGLLFDLHATTATQAAILVFTLALWRVRQRPRDLLLGPLVFALGAAPLAVPTLLRGGGVPTPFPDDWLQVIELHFPFHHLIEFVPPQFFAYLIVPAIAIVLIERRRATTAMRAFSAGVAICMALAVAGVYLLKAPLLVQMHFFEATRFLTVLGAIAAAAATVDSWRRGRATFWRGLPLMAAFLIVAVFSGARSGPIIVGPIALLLLIVGGIVHWRARRREAAPALAPFTLRPRGAGVILAALVGLVLVCRSVRGADSEARLGTPELSRADVVCRGELEAPATRAGDEEACGMRVMRWLREHTPTDAVIAIPPLLEHPLNAVAYFARRRPFWTFKEGGEATFSLATALDWRQRLGELLGPDLAAPLQPRHGGAWFQRLVAMRKAYGELDPARLQRLQALGVGYLVMPRAAAPRPGGPAPVYADGAFEVYALTAAASAPRAAATTPR
jgi:hypothetical protein